MAITQLSTYSIGDTDLTAMITTLDKTYKGKAEISLSAYSTTAAPDVQIGSVFENNGTLFVVDTADITPTGYAGITVSTTFYLYYDADPGAFVYLETVPTWSDDLQGWYNGNDRAFFSMYKDSGGTLYQLKQELGKQKIPGDTIEDITINNTLNVDGEIFPTVTTSGVWSVDTTTFVIPKGVYNVAFGSGSVDIEIYVNGGWRVAIDFNSVNDSYGGSILSDGTNVRVNASTASTTYYQKF